MTQHKRHPLVSMALIVIAVLVASGACASVTDPGFRLTFDKPASNWNEALPLGNGRIGVMVFGGVQDEHLQINESTLWGGDPHDYTNADAYAHLGEFRKLIFAGDIGEAEKLSESMMGKPKLLMPYQPFCDLRLHFPGDDHSTNYHRELDLDHAVAVTTYKTGEVSFRREEFVSYPDQVLVVRLTANQPGQITFDVTMDSPQAGTQIETASNDTLQLKGQIQPRQNPASSWTGSWDKPGMRFAAVLKVLPDGGAVRATAERLEVVGANAVTLIFSNATSFRNYRDIDGDASAAAQAYLQQALKHSYASLMQRHQDDFNALFSRVQLHLGDDHSIETTDQRIKHFNESNDPTLLALYFEFGRYLLIASSRPGGQPANLQGIWNQDLLPAWSSKWTTNINLEMNYWQGDVDDLWEIQQPLWSLIRDLRVTGAETARVDYHSNGWALHHNTDIWRATTPVDGSWGLWPMGAVWLSNQMWDHYEFSEDNEFLRKEAYPAMKQAAEFVLDSLVEAPAGTPFAGKLVTNPSTSPENHYLLNGKPYGLTYAATMDIELITALFKNCQHAAQILGVDAVFSNQLGRTLKRLPPLQIGKRGQLQEWIEDYAELEPQHRHVSHLYALYPGHDISLSATPELAAAAMKSLELRGDGGTGWSTVWRIALWSRLQNAQHAYNNLKILINTSTLPNMFDLCPPFQIDGNLGAPAAMTEMLVQSTSATITVLPALPDQWPNGELKGARVRGGGKIDISWMNGKLSSIRLQASNALDHARKYRIKYRDQAAEVRLQPGKAISLNASLQQLKP